MESKIRTDIDIVRSIATICVIGVHSLIRIGFYTETDVSVALFLTHFLRCFLITCVPLFLLITGFMNSKKSYKRFELKIQRILELICIYLICSIICVSIQFIQKDISIIDGIISIINFSAAPYAWYLAMYIGLFVLLPLLNYTWKKIDSLNGEKYLIFVMIILCIIPTVTNNLNVGDLRWWNGSQSNHTLITTEHWVNLYPIMYYFLGCIISKYEGKIAKKGKYIFILFILAIIFTTINFYRNLGSEFTWDMATSYGGYQCVLISFLIFILLLHSEIKPVWIKKMIHSFAEYSFGIYMISWVFDSIAGKGVQVLSLNYSYRFLLLPIIMIFVLLCSYICSIPITQISRFVVKTICKAKLDK